MGFFTKKSALDSSCCSVRGSEHYLDFLTILDEDTYVLLDSINSSQIGNVRILDVFKDGLRIEASAYTYDPNTSELVIIGQTTADVPIHVNYELI